MASPVPLKSNNTIITDYAHTRVSEFINIHASVYHCICLTPMGPSGVWGSREKCHIFQGFSKQAKVLGVLLQEAGV